MTDSMKVKLPFAEFLSRKELTTTVDPIVVDTPPVNLHLSFITIANTLPDPLLVSAEVEDGKAWLSTTYRPDIELPKNSTGGTSIAPFAMKTICVEVASSQTALKYAITVGFDMPAQTKPDQIPTPLVFQFDQTRVFTNTHVSSPPQDISAVTLPSLAVNKWLEAFVKFQMNEKGEPGVVFYISTPNED